MDRLAYRMKRPRGGSPFLLLEPDELLARHATLVPPPRTHSVRYHGIFAPSSKARAAVARRILLHLGLENLSVIATRS